MRRVLATATLGLALLGMAACADTDVPAAGSSATPSAAAASSAAPAAPALDKAAACDAYAKAEEAAKKPVMELALQLDTIKADPAKAQQALTDLTKAFTDFQAALTPVAAGVSDPELKAAVESDIEVLKKLPPALLASGGDIEKAVAVFDNPEFAKAGEGVKAICGK